MKQELLVGVALLSIAFAATGTFDYNANPKGSDWTTAGWSCAAGTNQSPIDFVGDDFADGKYLNLDFSGETSVSATLSLEQGKKVELADDSGEMKVTGTEDKERTFDFVQFHFHTPSEHTVNGKQYPAELHFVHYHKDSERYTVLGMFLSDTEGTSWPTKDFFKELDLENAGKDKVSVPMDFLLNELPNKGKYYHYLGSLTTPPCTEAVNWYVLKKPMKIDSDDLTKLKALLDNNNARATQNINGRTIYEGYSSVLSVFGSLIALLALY